MAVCLCAKKNKNKKREIPLKLLSALILHDYS